MVLCPSPPISTVFCCLRNRENEGCNMSTLRKYYQGKGHKNSLQKIPSFRPQVAESVSSTGVLNRLS